MTITTQHHRLRGRAAQVQRLETVVVHLVDQDGRVAPRPPWVVASMMAKVSKKAHTMLITSRKKVVGVSSGNWMLQNRRQGLRRPWRRPRSATWGSIAGPQEEQKVVEICFHTAARTISVSAWVELSRWFQWMPTCFPARRPPRPGGRNMNTHSTPATAAPRISQDEQRLVEHGAAHDAVCKDGQQQRDANAQRSHQQREPGRGLE